MAAAPAGLIANGDLEAEGINKRLPGGESPQQGVWLWIGGSGQGVSVAVQERLGLLAALGGDYELNAKEKSASVRAALSR